jgi:hypothetical protein
MKKVYTLLSCFLFLGMFSAKAQYSRYVIRLKNKNGNPYTLSNPSAFLSAKAIQRRTKYKLPLDSTDLPITPAYTDSILAVPNVILLNKSKWLNQVCIKTTDSAALAKINSFSFVLAISPVAAAVNPATSPVSGKYNGYDPVKAGPPDIIASPNGTGTNYFDYGNNLGQVHIHDGEFLHNNGFHGEGMTIAILDAGFRNYTTNPVFDSMRLNNQVLGHWDYVDNEPGVNEDHPHGAWCLSILAANSPGNIIGTAPKAKYWLLRTEDAATEYPVEEQNWAAGAEFADSAGVDMISSSLGYGIGFSDPVFNTTHAQRDGNSTIVSIAAKLAVRKGILVTNSAGNSGNVANDDKYVLCPADADSVLSIGAVDANGAIAGFSSWGPNGAGVLKPDVASVGVNAIVADVNTGAPVKLNGTSLSNPNICGLIACLWQAFPEFSNMEIIDAVKRSADRYTNPDNHYGYGIPNMRIAYGLLLNKRTTATYRQILGNNWIKAYPVPFNSNFTVLLKAPLTGKGYLRLVDMSGKTIEQRSLDMQQDNLYPIVFSKSMGISKGVYTIQYIDAKNKTFLRIVKQ